MTRSRWFALAVGIAFAILCGFLRAADPPQLKLVRELLFDEYQRLSPRPYEPMPVRIVDIDEASLQGDRAMAVATQRTGPPGREACGPRRRVGRRSTWCSGTGPPVAGRRSHGATISLGHRRFSRVDHPGRPPAGHGRPVRRSPSPAARSCWASARCRRRTAAPTVEERLRLYGREPAPVIQRFVGGHAQPARRSRSGRRNRRDQRFAPGQPGHHPAGLRCSGAMASASFRASPSRPCAWPRGSTRSCIRSTDAPPAPPSEHSDRDFEVPTTRTGELRVRFSRDVPERYVSALRILAEPAGGRH